MLNAVALKIWPLVKAAIGTPPLSASNPAFNRVKNDVQFPPPLFTWHQHANSEWMRLDWEQAPTAPQIAQVDAIVAAYVLPTQTVESRSLAKDEINDISGQGIAKRAIVGVTIDEINILRAQTVAVATFVFDPASMANNTGLTQTAVVPGVAFGDIVNVTAPYTLAGVVVTGYVHAAGTVGIRLHNSTGAAVNLASGTWRIVVQRLVLLPDRTLAQARTAIENKADSGATDT